MAFFEISQRIVDQDDTMQFYHNHSFFELYFLLNGKKIYYTEKSFYKLSAGYVTISKPNSFHKFEGGPFNRILIAFDNKFLSSFQEKYLCSLSDNHPVFSFDNNNFTSLSNTLLELLTYYNENVNKDFEKLNMYLSYILWLLYTQSKYVNHYKNNILDKSNKNYIPNISSIIYKLLQELDLNYNTNFDLDKFSATYHISRAWLFTHFKQATGLTMIEYKHKRQIEHAKQLLDSTTYSINKIASLVGFSSPSYFIKTFMKITCTTPLKYRNVVKARK